MSQASIKVPAGWIVPEQTVHQRNVRGIALADMQLVCGAGPYELDLLVREQLSRPNLQFVGQVTLASKVFEPAADVSVVLVKAHTPESVADTRTDDFGEFDMVSDRDAVYGLRIGNGEDAPHVLVWEGE